MAKSTTSLGHVAQLVRESSHSPPLKKKKKIKCNLSKGIMLNLTQTLCFQNIVMAKETLTRTLFYVPENSLLGRTTNFAQDSLRIDSQKAPCLSVMRPTQTLQILFFCLINESLSCLSPLANLHKMAAYFPWSNSNSRFPPFPSLWAFIYPQPKLAWGSKTKSYWPLPIWAQRCLLSILL